MNPHAQRLLDRIATREAKVAVVGLGYVGLPTAIAFARQGFPVIGADLSARKVEALERGESPLVDLDLGKDVAEVVANGTFRATTDVAAACAEADCVLLIVPTPVHESKQPDLSFVEAASLTAGKALKAGQFVVLESTTYPGTSDEIMIPILERESGLGAGTDFGVGYCPERYNPGDPEHTLDQIYRVVGAIDDDWCQVASALYGTLNGGKITPVRDLKTAEAAKVIENIQRDLNIALANELALVFERLGIDYYEVVEAAATKWNFVKYLPGPGVGGHCLPVDPYYLTSVAERHGYHPRVILAGRATNDSMPQHVVELIADGLNETGRAMKGTKVAVLGLSYKGNTGDARESPAVDVVRGLLSKGANVAVHEPLIDAEDIVALTGVDASMVCGSVDDALRGAHAVVVLTDHSVFRSLEPAALAKPMTDLPVFVDTRNLWEPADVEAAGFVYRGVGRRHKA